MSEIVAIENENIVVKLLSLGATVMSFYVKHYDIDIALGFDEVEKYISKGNASMGKSVGRCANRIGNARFVLNDKEYHLLANNGPNCLHGGEVRYGDVEWTIKEKTKTRVVFTYDSKDMESGFPGTLHVEAIYEVNDNELNVTYLGISDKDTIFNMTNHTYFNLDKMKTNILYHEMKIPSEKICLNDENGMAMEETLNVEKTPFDFRDFKQISEVISANGIPLNEYCKKLMNKTNSYDSEKVLIDNLDTNYVYETSAIKTLCILRNDVLSLKVKSDLPCVQIYTGKSLDIDGKDGHYGMYAGIAIEPQYCPNAINYNSFMKPIIKANERVSHTIKYIVEHN